MLRIPVSPRPVVVVAWCSVYALVHIWWAVAGDPGFFAGGSPDGCETMCGESPLPGGWLPVVLSGAAALGALGLSRRPPGWPAVSLAGIGGAGMVAYCMLFWIGLAMALMVPFGVPMSGDEVGLLLVRGAGAVGGMLAVSVALVELRRRHQQRHPLGRAASTPWWGWVGGYLVVAGCAARTLPYLSDVIDGWEREGAGFRVFVVLLMLSGSMLPLALVHRWGRIWPRWTGPLAGRDVPRWLVLGPGLFLGAGLTAYFGVGGFGAIITGEEPFAVPIVVMMSGYTAWGVGLLIASASYARLTRGSGKSGGSTLRRCPSDPPCSSGSRCSQCRPGSSSPTEPAS